MSKSGKEVEESEFQHGFYELPDEREREKMSIIDLAELLSRRKKGSVQHIVLSHELDLKIARNQANLNQRGIWIALAGTLVGSILGSAATAFFSSLSC